MRTLFLIFVIGIHVSSFAERLSGKHLNSVFSAACRSQGQFTLRALNDSEALISVLEQVRDDEDCKSIAGSVGNLRSIQQTIQSIEENNQINIDIEKLAAQESELMTQLMDSQNPIIIQELQFNLRQVQSDKASLIAQRDGANQFYARDTRDLYISLVQSSETVLNTLSANTQCLNKNPNLLSAVTALGGSIAAASSAFNPAFAIGLSALTQIFGQTVEYFRKRPFNLIIRRITNSTLALEGYKCALQSLSQTWCSNKDAENLVNLKARLRADDISAEPLNPETIIIRNDREIPVFLDWLQKVKAGVTPSSLSEGERQSRVIEREAGVKSRERIGLGIISEEEDRFRSTPPTRQFDSLKFIIQKLTESICYGSTLSNNSPSTGSSVLYEVFGGDIGKAAYFLLGIDQPVTNGDGETITFCQFTPGNLPNFSPDYTILKTRYNQWIEDARRLVSGEINRTIQPDPIATLTEAFDPSANQFKLAPLDAIKKIRDFLLDETNQENYRQSGAFRQIYNDTLRRLNQIIDIIEGAILTFNSEDADSALQEVAEIANLESGITLFQNRLSMMVRNTIQEYYQRQVNNNDPVASQLLAAESFLNTLQTVKGNDNLALIMSDILSAQQIALNNMNALTDIFGKNIKSILKDNYKIVSESNDRELVKVYKRTNAQFCLLLSSMPSWPEDIPKKYCINTQIPAIISGGPTSPVISYNYLAEPFEKRNCGYRNFIRKSKIYQSWGTSFDNN